MNLLFKFCLLLSLITLMQAKMQRLQMHKDPNSKTMGNILGMQKSLAKKYNIDIQNAPCPEEVDNFNATYYSYIYIGTPPQRVKVIFDTEIAGVMAMSSQYDPSTSTSSLISDGSYFAYDPLNDDSTEASQMYLDVVSISNLALASQAVALYDDSIGEFGRVGLGLVGPNTKTFGTVLGNLKNSGLITTEMFSMYFVNQATSSAPAYAGEIIFGGSDPSAYTGSLTYVNTTAREFYSYQFQVDSISIGDKKIAKQFTAILDTFSDLISTPLLPYALINAKLGGVIDDNGNYFVNCSTVSSLPTVDIQLGGKTLSLEPAEYILNIIAANGDVQCMSAFAYTDSYNWVFGTSFMANKYFEFDVSGQRLGWANAAPYSGSTSVHVPSPATLPLPKKVCA